MSVWVWCRSHAVVVSTYSHRGGLLCVWDSVPEDVTQVSVLTGKGNEIKVLNGLRKVRGRRRDEDTTEVIPRWISTGYSTSFNWSSGHKLYSTNNHRARPRKERLTAWLDSVQVYIHCVCGNQWIAFAPQITNALPLTINTDRWHHFEGRTSDPTGSGPTRS